MSVCVGRESVNVCLCAPTELRSHGLGTLSLPAQADACVQRCSRASRRALPASPAHAPPAQVSNVFDFARDAAVALQRGVETANTKLRDLRELLVQLIGTPHSVQDAAILAVTARDTLRTVALLPVAAGALAADVAFSALPPVVTAAVDTVGGAMTGPAVPNLRAVAAAAGAWEAALGSALAALRAPVPELPAVRARLDVLLNATGTLRGVAALDVGPLTAVGGAVGGVVAAARAAAPAVCGFTTRAATPLGALAGSLQLDAVELTRLQRQLVDVLALIGLCEDGIDAANEVIADQVEAVVDVVNNKYKDIKRVAMRVFKAQVRVRGSSRCCGWELAGCVCVGGGGGGALARWGRGAPAAAVGCRCVCAAMPGCV
jgi:hypothetical protein